MANPRPESARFLGLVAQGKPPAPPFGLERWTEDGAATVVQLDASTDDLGGFEAVVRQVPDCGSLPSRTLVVILGDAGRGGGVWRRLVRMNTVPVSRSTRCSALLARGYVDIGGGLDEGSARDLAWGWSP